MKKGIGTENGCGQVTTEEVLFLVQGLVLTSNHRTIVNIQTELICNPCSIQCSCTNKILGFNSSGHILSLTFSINLVMETWLLLPKDRLN